MEENETKGFKVNDRRRFDSMGNEVEETSAKGSAAPKAEPRSERPTAAPEKPAAEAAPNFTHEDAAQEAEGQVTFHSFVMSLAMQALMLLGEVRPPPGAEIAVDREAAKQTIDILSMLEQKTRGNLDPEEKFFLEETLHNLRMSFVRRGHLG